LILFVAQTCQKARIRLTKEQAIATAQQQVDFRPTQTQVRLVRQGLNSHPFWAVSLSIPTGPERYSRLTTVRVDANTGKVAAVNREIGP
jgi:peptidase YpeB-like protein